ncbi:DUF3426 domain-containing protein [uncultured Desulfobacter sp.]|uniref:DUF3426 domain-containing protein n=1 Tax=uncultured Desulfobacter sp. TaxID=240139 RepID=UPI002AAC279A|nr:DUF3426 domain-containing protein [uncultured Desulfobacter sp.]
MIITCEKCLTRFALDDALIKPGGSKVRCSQCQHVFTAFPAKIPDVAPEIEMPDLPEPQVQAISFDAPELQGDSGPDEPLDGDFDITYDSDSQDTDMEDLEIDFPDLDFDEPDLGDTGFNQDRSDHQADPDAAYFQKHETDIEDPNQNLDDDGLDFESAEFKSGFGLDESESDLQDGGLELDAPDFEFEEIKDAASSMSVSVSADEDTADIEISFDQEEGLELELADLSFDMDNTAEQASFADGLELEAQEDEVPELELDNGSQADLAMEDDGADSFPESEDVAIDVPALHHGETTEEQSDIPADEDDLSSNVVNLELGDAEEPDARNVDDEAGEEVSEATEQAVSDQDKFEEYDKVLEQQTEPENSAYVAEISQPLTESPIETATDELMDPDPLVDPPSAQSIRQKRGAKKKQKGSLMVKILLVLLLLLLAVYVAIIRLGLNVPMVSDIQLPFITEWLQPKQAPQPPLKPVPDEPSIDGRFVSNKSAGDLFVVTGRINNPSRSAVSYIQVKGALMTKNNAKASVLTAYCGNIISEEELKSGNISDITKQMSVRGGNQNTNVNIKPGGSIMFMLVFSNLPEDLANFTVAVQEYEPAEK